MDAYTTYDDLDLLEQGFAKEIVKDDIYMPCHKSREWARCYVSIGTDDTYNMYIEKSNRFLLSAKQLSFDHFIISYCENFPLLCHDSTSGGSKDHINKRGVVANLIRKRSSTFILSLNHCRLCDNKLGKFTCGRGCYERECLAKISHSTRKLSNADADIRCMHVSIPSFSEEGQRLLWCPRSLRILNDSLPISSDMCDSISSTPGASMKCLNKLPEWNSKLGSLVLKFQGNRIQAASTKNFLLFKQESFDSTSKCNAYTDESTETDLNNSSSRISRNGHSDSKTNHKRRNEQNPTHADFAILQFGKGNLSTYILDFQHPLSPLQAFAIALTTFAFNIDDNSKFKK